LPFYAAVYDVTDRKVKQSNHKKVTTLSQNGCHINISSSCLAVLCFLPMQNSAVQFFLAGSGGCSFDCIIISRIMQHFPVQETAKQPTE
jgi:hypothetical protein